MRQNKSQQKLAFKNYPTLSRSINSICSGTFGGLPRELVFKYKTILLINILSCWDNLSRFSRSEQMKFMYPGKKLIIFLKIFSLIIILYRATFFVRWRRTDKRSIRSLKLIKIKAGSQKKLIIKGLLTCL